jgi:hypothetical protein
MTMMTAERELVESLADLQDFFAEPPEKWEKRHQYGTPLEGRLKVYGNVEPWNVNSALWLLRALFAEKLRSANREWVSLPEDVRRRIEVEAMLIRFERVVAALELAAEEVGRAMEGIRSEQPYH